MPHSSKSWVLKELDDSDVVGRLSQDLNGLAEPLARSLALRGVRSMEDAKVFFRAGLSDLHDPFLMQDMHAATDRVVAAIRKGERVLVYGDYDVDGITATTCVTHFLRERGVPATFFIPDRLKHGYGLCPAGLDHAVEQRATLVIALDCGVTARDEAAYARKSGLDLVICDHHTPPEVLPDAVAVLDPKRSDCSYPFKELCGCGVAFQLLRAVLVRLGEAPEVAWQYLDLVALATASDVVPIQGENRILLREGLDRLRRKERLGISALAEVAQVKLQECSTRNILFSLGPRINAAGRLGDATQAVQLLLAETSHAAAARARHLERLNSDRRTIDQSTLESALREAEEWEVRAPGAGFVLFDPSWHIGVLGIVASRLVERFRRPVILLGLNGDVAKGSARSTDGVNIYDAIASCSDQLEAFGGHDMAAGLTLRPEYIDAFRVRFVGEIEEARKHLVKDRPLEVDASVRLSDIDERFWAVLRQFEPFGPANEPPVFRTSGVEVAANPTVVGRGHLKFRVREPGGNRPSMEAIGFGLGDQLPLLEESYRLGLPIDLAHTVTENVWNGIRTLQLSVDAVRRTPADA